MKKTSLCRFVTFIMIITCSSFSYGQTITTYAGSGDTTGFMSGSYSGDGGAATAARLFNPGVSAFDRYGNLYIPDVENSVIRKVQTTGIISTIAGNGTASYSGDGGPATSAALSYPSCVTFDAYGNLYIADQGNMRIRKVDTLGIITTVAGTGGYGFSGDGGPAINAVFNNPDHVIFDASGNLYVCDWGNYRLRMIDATGMIRTIAGNGSSAYSGDGGPATAAGIGLEGILFDHSGNILICDAINNRIRKVDPSGTITTFAGTGGAALSGDGGPATAATFNFPGGLAYDLWDDIIIADEDNQAIRKIDPLGIITTIAGTAISGYSGDGGPATAAEFDYPDGIVFDAVGNLYVSDLWNNRVRKINFLPATTETKTISSFSFDIYPNPATDVLHVNNLKKSTDYCLFDIHGCMLQQGSLGIPGGTISLKALAPGIYLLNLSDNEGGYKMVRVAKE
jgi:sugar lactone lactonase YvrE